MSGKEYRIFGYSGVDANFRMIQRHKENLFHEVFCKAEWIARSIRETWYNEVVKQTIGIKNYNQITA